MVAPEFQRAYPSIAHMTRRQLKAYSSRKEAYKELVLSQDSSQSARLFEQLIPYFDGKHQVEEILWMENITIEILNTLVQQYSDVLFTSLLA